MHCVFLSGHRKKKKSKSLQNEPEPPPKLIIRWKGGQLTSVISDKADKKTLISDGMLPAFNFPASFCLF